MALRRERTDGLPVLAPRGFYSTSGARRRDAGAVACCIAWPGRRSSTSCPCRSCRLTWRCSWCRWRIGRCRPAGTTVGHFMTRACASVVEARGSFSRGFLDAGRWIAHDMFRYTTDRFHSRMTSKFAVPSPNGAPARQPLAFRRLTVEASTSGTLCRRSTCPLPS
jgi:hypothetical protein